MLKLELPTGGCGHDPGHVWLMLRYYVTTHMKHLHLAVDFVLEKLRPWVLGILGILFDVF